MALRCAAGARVYGAGRVVHQRGRGYASDVTPVVVLAEGCGAVCVAKTSLPGASQCQLGASDLELAGHCPGPMPLAGG